MKLRTAIKIMRYIEEPERNNWRLSLRWKPPTIWKARDICRRHWRDHRVPYMPGDDELLERAGIAMSLFADVFIKDETDRDEFKNCLWLDIDSALKLR